MEVFLVLVALAFAGFLLFNMFRTRKRRMAEAAERGSTAPAVGISVSRDIFPGGGGHAPVESFHVAGEEARVTFDVPLGDEEDEVLHELLLDQAFEVLRQRRHELPITDVQQIVVFAGREPVREVARHKLHTPGELPAPTLETGVSLTHIAHDPFAAHFSDDMTGGITYGTSVEVPEDELPPLRDELRLPKGLDRGLRALGTDPEQLSGPDFVLALLKMFGYRVTEQAYEDSFLAIKDGVSTYIVTDAYQPGYHPELDETVIRRFLANFGSSGADRGILISDRYSPFMIYEIEANQPKVRFVTRERVQRFVDSMALG